MQAGAGQEPTPEQAKLQAQLEEWFGDHYSDLVRAASRKLGAFLRAKLEAEDLVQTACGKIVASARRGKLEFRSDEELHAYCMNAVQQKLIDKVRFFEAERREAKREQFIKGSATDSGPMELAASSNDPTPSAPARLEERRERLRSAMAALTDEQRRVVHLYYLQDHTLEETAGLVGKSVGYVRHQLDGALKRLHGVLPTDL